MQLPRLQPPMGRGTGLCIQPSHIFYTRLVPGMTSSLAAAVALLASAPGTALILMSRSFADPGRPPAACPGPAGPLNGGAGVERGAGECLCAGHERSGLEWWGLRVCGSKAERRGARQGCLVAEAGSARAPQGPSIVPVPGLAPDTLKGLQACSERDSAQLHATVFLACPSSLRKSSLCKRAARLPNPCPGTREAHGNVS